MKNQYFYYLSFLCLVVFFSCKIAPIQQETKVVWPEVRQTAKPWTRWWWHGSSVTKKGITAELEAYQKAGIGGLELTPIYGQKGDENNFINYLSPEWMNMLEYTLKEANRLDLGVDMATGTGWPFGGPWVDADMASKYMAHKKYVLKEGQRLNQKIEFIQSPLLRKVRSSDLKMKDLSEPIAGNKNLQKLALDQVRFEKPLPLQTLIAYADNGKSINLTDKVKEDGLLDWVAPAGNWNLYAVFQGWHGKMVERAAPGGEGNVIDHFSTTAINKYLKKFDTAFKGRNIQTLRAFFNDSYEVDDASGQADWTPDLLVAFKKRRGYDLQAYLPALFGEDTDEINKRVLSDYRETISDLILTTFTQTWAKWALKNNGIIRNQAHGSPANILDLYAASDIPETEGTDMIKIKMASSAAHLANRSLVSAEAATWLGEHFTTNLADLKRNVDRYLAGGINHIFYHGTSYSPPEEAWPGRLFYAAVHANPRNSLWHDLPVLNNYITRTQSYLQEGTPNNEVLLYLPAYDRYATSRSEMLEHFDGLTMGKKDTVKTFVREVAEWLQGQGYGYDFVSDKQLTTLDMKAGKLTNGANAFTVIVVPETQYMPLSTLKKLLAFANKGIPVIFQNKLPATVPGLADLESRKKAFNELITSSNKENIIVDKNLATAFDQTTIERETFVDNGLEFNRRSHKDGTTYFIANWSENNQDGWIELSSKAKSVVIFDPMTDKFGLAKTRLNNNGKLELYLQLNKGVSIILKTFNEEVIVKNWLYLKKKGTPINLNGNWELSFLKGGPTLPPTQILPELKMWTDLNNDAFNKFSGTAKYTLEFPKPKAVNNGWVLDLGKVAEQARVVLNGKKIGTSFGPIHQFYIPKNVIKATNLLEVEVTNLMTNRIIDLEKSGGQWKNFYNINISANKRENLGTDRVFTAAHWTPRPSGLSGAITLTVVE